MGFCIDLQNSELNAAQRRANELSARVSELEEALSRTQRELQRAQENNAKLQRDLRENQAQKVDQVLFGGILYLGQGIMREMLGTKSDR